MCPLRLILIFLSATLAGFFVIRNLRSPAQQLHADNDLSVAGDDSSDPTSRFSKTRLAIKSGFWTCVDMASGRYLWKHLVSSSSSSSKRSD